MVSQPDRTKQLKVCSIHLGDPWEARLRLTRRGDKAPPGHRDHLQRRPGRHKSLSSPPIPSHIPWCSNKAGVPSAHHIRVGLVCDIHSHGRLVSSTPVHTPPRL